MTSPVKDEGLRRLAVRHGQRVYGAWLCCASPALSPRAAVKIAVGRLRRDRGSYGPSVMPGWTFDVAEHERRVAYMLEEAKRLGVTLD